jgi:hypothetical protein
MQVTYSTGRVKTTVVLDCGFTEQFGERLSKKEAIRLTTRSKTRAEHPGASPKEIDALLVDHGQASWTISAGFNVCADDSIVLGKPVRTAR